MTPKNSSNIESQNPFSWEEKVRDHAGKIEEYIENCAFRGCSVETTLPAVRCCLTRIFSSVKIDDPIHPDGSRHLLAFEVLHPVLGPFRLGLIIRWLMSQNLARDTVRRYVNILRYFCEYVIAKPNVPGTSEVTLTQKYGPMALSFTKYDVPVHVQDRPKKKRIALAPPLRDEFYEFMRTGYITNHVLPHIGARDYVAVVLQTEIGARISELMAIQAGGDRRDIDDERGKIRLFGKAKRYGGKRIRWVLLTDLARQVLNAYERVFLPMFPKAEAGHLFLNADGSPLTTAQYGKVLKTVVKMSAKAGVPIPEELTSHDLRRTCATNNLEKNPLGYRKVLKMLGHTYPSSAAPYLIATDDDVEEAQSDLNDIFVDPHIIKRGLNQ